jgi:hypothetical protein
MDAKYKWMQNRRECGIYGGIQRFGKRGGKPMKKSMWLLLGLFFVTGCLFNKGLNLSYLTPVETPIEAKPFYLRVKDVRTEKVIVSPEIQEKGMFNDVGDRVNVTTKTADGKTVDVKNVSLEEGVREMVKARAEALGMKLLNEFAQDKPSLTVELEMLNLKLQPNRTMLAEATVTIKYFQGAQQIHTARINRTKEQFYVRGEQTAQEALSEALSAALNMIELKRFMN